MVFDLEQLEDRPFDEDGDEHRRRRKRKSKKKKHPAIGDDEYSIGIELSKEILLPQPEIVFVRKIKGEIKEKWRWEHVYCCGWFWFAWG